MISIARALVWGAVAIHCFACGADPPRMPPPDLATATSAPSSAPNIEPVATQSAAVEQTPAEVSVASVRFEKTAVSSRTVSSIEPALGTGAEAGTMLCKTWARFGPPEAAERYDVRFDFRDKVSGIALAVWAQSYGLSIGTVGDTKKSKDELNEIVAAARTFLMDAQLADCEATFTLDAEARTLGVRQGKAFSEAATFEKGLLAQLRRISWAASVKAEEYGGPSFEADDRAIYYWKEAAEKDRKSHPEALAPLEQALLRWLGRSRETMNPAWLSPLAKKATCSFLRSVRPLIPITEKANKKFADQTQARFCSP